MCVHARTVEGVTPSLASVAVRPASRVTSVRMDVHLVSRIQTIIVHLVSQIQTMEAIAVHLVSKIQSKEAIAVLLVNQIEITWRQANVYMRQASL